MSAYHHPRDLLAFDKISVTQPFWRGFETAKSQIGIEDNVFLHAGPAFTTVDEICQPIINSTAVGAVFEGLAKSLDDAVNMVRSGEIILKPAQDHNVVTPLAAVVTPNMPLHYVYDGNHGNHYCLTPINGGTGPAIRLGQRSYEAVEHLHWINGPMLDFMASSLGEGEIAGHTMDVSGSVTLHVEVLKRFAIDGPVLFPLEEDLPPLAKPLTNEERKKGARLASSWDIGELERLAPISVVGTAANLNEAIENGLDRASKLLDMGIPEVRNRATINGAIEIGRAPGVIQVTFLAPLDKLDKAGLGDLAREQYNIA